MQRLFEEENNSPPHFREPSFLRKNSVPFIQETKEEEDEKKQPHRSLFGSPIPRTHQLPPTPPLRGHLDSLVEPIPEEDLDF